MEFGKILVLVFFINFSFVCVYGKRPVIEASGMKFETKVGLFAEEECNLPAEYIEEIQSYKDTTDKIIDFVTKGALKGRAYNELAKFVDLFGHRMTGSHALEESIDYMLEKMKNEKYDHVFTDQANVPHWERGYEKATLIEPREKNLALLGLGNSVATLDDQMISGEVIVVKSFDELKANSAKVSGKIVVYNQAWTGYGSTVAYRSGASEASRHGAIATLIKSVAPFSLDTPHTGVQDYDEGVKKIPTGCITIEDAELLQRFYDHGEKIVVNLTMQHKDHGMKISRNAFGQITGTQFPEKIVGLSGHIDSWDVGQGAMDDGGGVLISTEAIYTMIQLNLKPKRTVQAMMWTAEEVGLIGVNQFVDRNPNLMANYSVVFESDSGTFRPLGLDFAGSPDAGCIIEEILKLAAPIEASEYHRYERVSSDITVMQDKGVPGLSLNNANNEYFWYHHTEADTMTMQDEEEMDLDLALWTLTSFVIADLSFELPRGNSSVWIGPKKDNGASSFQYNSGFLCISIIFYSFITSFIYL